jgi:hypothetical protein
MSVIAQAGGYPGVGGLKARASPWARRNEALLQIGLRAARECNGGGERVHRVEGSGHQREFETPVLDGWDSRMVSSGIDAVSPSMSNRTAFSRRSRSVGDPLPPRAFFVRHAPRQQRVLFRRFPCPGSSSASSHTARLNGPLGAGLS